jgi:hypothetical protein
MLIESIWLTKFLLAHLITDFILQPKSWIEDRKQKHFSSGKLYLHSFITALGAWVLIGWQYWIIALVIFITHLLIDGWKSYQKESIKYFLIDQAIHIAVIILCWYFTFLNWQNITFALHQININKKFWSLSIAFIFLTMPVSILIGQLTKQWREKITDSESLANAGKWIGMIERTIILILILKNQYDAIGLLIAAKGIIRFNEKERPEIKTEYLVIGTLLSLIIAVITGLILVKL